MGPFTKSWLSFVTLACAKARSPGSLLLISSIAVILMAAWSVLFPALAIAQSAEPWQEKTEIVWEEAAGKLVRRSFRVVDPHPELGLEFAWTPYTSSGTRAGAISGSGQLIWYRKGASPYDRTSRFSTYTGGLKDGLLDGYGKLSTRAGLTYEGEWNQGRMEGKGSVEYETGERYQGSFAAGEPDGTGTYIGVDGQVAEGGFPKKATIRTIAIPLALSPPLPSPSSAARDSRTLGAVAQAKGAIAINLYVDRVKNNEFQQADTDLASFVYDQATGPGTRSRSGSTRRRSCPAGRAGGWSRPMRLPSIPINLPPSSLSSTL